MQSAEKNPITDKNPFDDESGDDTISRTFVPSITPTLRETTAINNSLKRVQSTNNAHVLWPEIDGFPINEFQTPGYMARAFPTLYPYGEGIYGPNELEISNQLSILSTCFCIDLLVIQDRSILL